MVKTFAIAAASAAPFIFLAAIGIFLIFILVLFAFIGYSARNTSFELDDQGLRIKGNIYGQFIPKEQVVGEGVRIINLDTSPEYKPGLRTNGIGLPGYSAGWFRLKNKEKALLFVTDPSKVVYLPTTKSYAILLSVSNPEDFYNSIKLWK
ncbi:MAG: hypothetical protein HW402_1161 [Dehalococcoidales bacterium]|nr:hypothetical protein [Dehalococcoidales bacterium]